ncbi:MAG: hypothetical protein JSV86_05445 [Gemmatimonadota bacterium]|nr:MAG: hypothetical protein JSV86_05445 [Gemmatimonadota bacterium]
MAAANGRTAASAVGKVGWAYLAAQSRSDWARGSIYLGLFQQLYNTYVNQIAEAGSAAGWPAAPPGRLAVSGAYDTQTRRALIYVLATLLGTRRDAPHTAVLDRFPDTAGGIAGWFPALDRAVASSSPIRDYDDLFRSTSPSGLVEAVSNAVFEDVEGGAPATGIPGAQPPLRRGDLVALPSPIQKVVANPGSAAAELIETTDVIRGSAPPLRTLPTWGWVVIAVVGAGAVGAVSYLAIRKWAGK